MKFTNSLKILLVGERTDGWHGIRAAVREYGAGDVNRFEEVRTVHEASEQLLHGDIDAVVLALRGRAMGNVYQLAIFHCPLVVCLEDDDAAMVEQVVALGAGDCLAPDEAKNPAVLVRALQLAIAQRESAGHARRAQKLLQRLSMADGVEVLMREAAHSIGNTLTPAQLFACQGQQSVPEPGKTFFAEIERTITDASQTLGRMHNLRRASDDLRSASRVVAIDEALRNALKPVRRLLPSNVELVVETEAAAGEQVLLDETEFIRVVTDLAHNAILSMRHRDEGVLRLKLKMLESTSNGAGEDARGSEGGVELEVTDNGCGIEPLHRDRIFDPFFTTRGEEGCVGLGLAACRSFVERHGGTIRVTSNPGEGSSFKLRFPSPDQMAGAAPDREFALGAGRFTMLMVDGDERLLTLTSHALRQLGITVLTASDGESARQQMALQGDRVELVLLDPALPDVHGLVLWRSWTARHPALRLLLTSTNLADLPGLDGPEAAGYAQLSKPFSLGQLTAHIERILAEE